jgi:hypothetical protein
MRLVDRLKYRWQYCSDPLPGEYCNPLPNEDISILMWTEPLDSEKIIFLRRLRALLFGYGQGWSFFGALLNFFFGIL